MHLSQAEGEALYASYRLPNGKYSCNGFDGPCDSKEATVARQRTSYADDRQNWACLCHACRKANSEYWDGMWADYYAMTR